MPAEYVVLTAERSKGDPDTHGNISYWVEVQNGDDSTRALLVQKPETPQPEPGVSLYGHLEELTSKRGNTYFRFRKDQREDGAGPPAHSQTAGAAASGAGGQGRGIDTRSGRIERQHSQSVAVDYAALMQAQGRLPTEFGPDDLRVLIDWFALDVNRGAV